MQTRSLALPTIGIFAATRGMLGAGIGLLLADKIDRSKRMRIGRTLIAIGAISTIPLAAIIRRSRQAPRKPEAPAL